MLNLIDSVRSHCADLEAAFVDRHFRRLPAGYFERYSAAEIARHLHQLARLGHDQPVGVDLRPLTSHAFEVTVGGEDHPGTVACITAALAAYGFNLEDVQVSTYLATDPEPGSAGEPNFFVILLRVSGHLHGRSAADMAHELTERLRLAFSYLVRGDILDAQAVAADTRVSRAEATRTTPHPLGATPAPFVHEGGLISNDFRLERKLATGGMSEVYLATQLSLNRTVAVKLVRHEAEPDDELLARFYQEGLVLGQFTCPYIVQILAAGTLPARAGRVVGWMAMEYMAGGDLARWQRQHGAPPPELAARWFRDALEGLHYAHRHAVLHRDIKPHNLLLTEEGHLKVSDFGLLKQARAAASGWTPHSSLIGTPHYMSPEQALGEPVDERSDIFSLGTTFFHLLSGRLPFDKNSMTAVLIQIAQEDAPRLHDVTPAVTPALGVMVSRMMARKREERYQDVGVILEDLASYERRGLVRTAESGAGFFPAGPAADVTEANELTQPYHPEVEGQRDIMT
jgi:hypothetical protein